MRTPLAVELGLWSLSVGLVVLVLLASCTHEAPLPVPVPVPCHPLVQLTPDGKVLLDELGRVVVRCP